MSIKTAKFYIREDGDKYKVVGEDGEVFGTHDTEDEAREQQKALYANAGHESSRRTAQEHQFPQWAYDYYERLYDLDQDDIEYLRESEVGAYVDGQWVSVWDAINAPEPPEGERGVYSQELRQWVPLEVNSSRKTAAVPAVTDAQVSQFQNDLGRIGYDIDADEAHDILVLNGGYKSAMDLAGLRSEMFNDARPGESDDEIDTEGAYGLSELVETTDPSNLVYDFVQWSRDPGGTPIGHLPEEAHAQIREYAEALRQPEWKARIVSAMERYSTTAKQGKTAMDFDFEEPKDVEFEMGDVSEVAEDIPEGINAELPSDVAETIAEEPPAFQDGFTDGYNDEPNAQELYEEGYEEGQEVLEDTAVPAEEVLDAEGDVEDVNGDGEAEDLEEILSSLQSARNRFTSLLSSDRASEAEIRHAAIMLERTENRISSIEEKVAERDSAEYLASISAPAADRFRHATVFVPHEEMVNIGEDDGSFLHAAAKDVLSQVDGYDWKQFAQVGARQWVLDQPKALLAHREVALEAAEDYAAGKATMLANEAHRAKVVQAFVANVEQRLVDALTEDEPVEEEDDPVQTLAKAASVGDQETYARVQEELHLNDDEAAELARIASTVRRADTFTWTDGDTTVDVSADEGYSRVEVTTPAADEFGADFVEPVFDATSEDGLVEAPLDAAPLDAEFEPMLEEAEEDEFLASKFKDPIRQAAYAEVFGKEAAANSYEYLTAFKNGWRENRDRGPGYSDANMQKVTDFVTERSGSQQEFIENLYYIADHFGLDEVARDLEWTLEDEFGFDSNTDYNYTLTPEDEDLLYPGVTASPKG